MTEPDNSLKRGAQYDRAAQDVGNIVGIGHVNVCIDDQHKATHFYITGLGYTRDPFLNTGAVSNKRRQAGKSCT